MDNVIDLIENSLSNCKNREEIEKKINEEIKDLGLQCIGSGGTPPKLSFIEIEGEGMIFKLTISFHNKIFIENFEGIMNIEDFTEILTKLVSKIKKLNL